MQYLFFGIKLVREVPVQINIVGIYTTLFITTNLSQLIPIWVHRRHDMNSSVMNQSLY